MYETRVILVKKTNSLFGWCQENAQRAKLLKNACLFRMRNLEFSVKKGFQNLNMHQLEVLNELNIHRPKNKSEISMKSHTVNYCWLDKVFKDSGNPDYNNGLPKHSAQRIIKGVVNSFRAYHAALRSYKLNPGKFTGKPNVPHYCENDVTTFEVSNQEAYIKNQRFLKLPKTKLVLDVGEGLTGKLLHVTVCPFYDCYKVSVVCETKQDCVAKGSKDRILGIDPGVNNFLTVSNNCGLVPFIVDGKDMKSRNQWFNKENVRLRSCLEKCQGVYASRRLDVLSRKRANYFRDKFHKISCYISKYCLEHAVGTVVYGLNIGWKQDLNFKKKDKQHFTYLAYSTFFSVLGLHLAKIGVSLVQVEESYTSKASFLDQDFIPVFGYKPDGWRSSGIRRKRGLYIAKDGTKINADVNGASNIIRKFDEDAFANVTDFSYLTRTVEKVQM